WPYSSSYQVVVTSFDRSQRWQNSQRITQANSHTYTTPGTAELGNRKMADVAFPAQKVWFYDSHQRHFTKRELYWAYPQARQPLLFFDTSVNVRLTDDANPGWRPNQPDQYTLFTQFTHIPSMWEAPLIPGVTAIMRGYYAWTRGGLRGVDFGGSEVRTLTQ